jgi:hypothetical protein
MSVMKRKTIKFARTNRGIPALWENLKKFSDMQRITVISNENGNNVDAIFTRLSDNSSLIPIKENYIISKIFKDNIGTGVTILKIVKIDNYSNNAEVEVLLRKNSDSNEWLHNDECNISIELKEKIIDNIGKFL